MIRIYGHSWPVRWGKAGAKRTVKVYSNCAEAELFLNGRSLGRKTRSSADFPAAGLRWDVPFEVGMNQVHASGFSPSGKPVTDEIAVRYETRAWKSPAKLVLTEVSRADDRVRLRTTLMDAADVVGLDARALVRFGHAGDGRLLDNLGTADGARVVQLANGGADIEVRLLTGTALVSVSTEGVPSTWLKIERPAPGASAAQHLP